MDKATALAVVKALGQLMRNGPAKPSSGICFNLGEILQKNENLGWMAGYKAVELLAQGWPKHTGYPSHPVPWGGGPLWEGNGLELRMELMAYMQTAALRIAQGDSLREVPIKSGRSLRRYVAAGYQIQERWAGGWHGVSAEKARERLAVGCTLRAIGWPEPKVGA